MLSPKNYDGYSRLTRVVIGDYALFAKSKWQTRETEEKAVKAILREPHISAAALAKLLGVKQRQAERVMSSLKRKAGLKRRGSDRRGEWYFASPAGM